MEKAHCSDTPMNIVTSVSIVSLYVTAGLKVPKNMYSALLTGISSIAESLSDIVLTTSSEYSDTKELSIFNFSKILHK